MKSINQNYLLVCYLNIVRYYKHLRFMWERHYFFWLFNNYIPYNWIQRPEQKFNQKLFSTIATTMEKPTIFTTFHLLFACSLQCKLVSLKRLGIKQISKVNRSTKLVNPFTDSPMARCVDYTSLTYSNYTVIKLYLPCWILGKYHTVLVTCFGGTCTFIKNLNI